MVDDNENMKNYKERQTYKWYRLRGEFLTCAVRKTDRQKGMLNLPVFDMSK